MTKVKLRKKSISDGRVSLYLDFYPAIEHPDTGKSTRREFLKIYLFEKPKTTEQRQHNKEKRQIANAIRSKREIALLNQNYDFLKTDKSKGSFISYFKGLVDERERTKTNYTSWNSTYLYLYRFTEGQLSCKKVNRSFVEKFKSYLLNTNTLKSKTQKLHQNSASSYFNVFREAIYKAIDDELLSVNPLKNVPTIKQIESQREYLEIEELERLSSIPCDYPVLKKAFLFSCLTGLRKSDIESLTWKEIIHSKEHGYMIRFRQQKTDIPQTLNIPSQAIVLIGERQSNEELVFKGFTEMDIYKHLPKWIKKAGIDKHITFHCARHTCATIHITKGTDLYIVSKLLGHSSIKHTQIYAKIIPTKKKEAVERLEDININLT